MNAAGGFGGASEEEFARYREAWRRRTAPANEIPAVVAVEALLAATDELAVFVTGVEVFSTGIGFRVQARTRPAVRRHRRRRRLLDGFFGDEGGRRGFLLGVEFTDGRRVSTLADLDIDPAADTPVLSDAGGEASERSASVEFFLSPLPPPGELQLVCAWPDVGVEETITRLPTEAILAAVERIQVLWPPASDEDELPEEEPPPPPLPPGGWFTGP